MAEGIAVNHPIRGLQIIDAVKKTGGDFILVGEKDIFHSQIDISRKGYFIEPTSAVVIAGIQKYIEKTKSTDIIVSALTGHGLKTGNRKKT
jgi:threonine synthase